MKNLKALFVLIVFTFTSIMPPQGWAQALSYKPNASIITAVGLMPKPGSGVSLSASFDLAHFKGMVIDPNDPFKFDFIIHQGDQPLSKSQKQQEYTKLVKYFLAALAVPDTDQWVNLSPYEKDRIIAGNFGKTEMGRDLLAQDYLLKQLSSSLTNPETSLGQKFWNQVYERVYQQFGTRNVPLNTFNKVWIVPDKAVIYEQGNMVYVISSHLKVMTEADYLAMKKHNQNQVLSEKGKAINISNQVMREIILPAIEKEVNEGKNFAPLRQVFSGMLLATWYKHALKESILARLYANKGKVKGIDQDPKANEKIYQGYLRAYKKGVYNMIKEETDPVTQEVIPRKYFSGGTEGYVNYAQMVERDNNVNDYTDDLTEQSSKLAMVSGVLKSLKELKKKVSLLALLAGLTFTPDIGFSQANVTLAWNAPTNPIVAGVNIYYGGAPGVYTNKTSVGMATSLTISNLTIGATYYFAATTYSVAGAESALSGSISYTVPVPVYIPPTLNPISNLTINENAGLQTVNLTGISSGATVTAVSSDTSLIPNLTVNYTNGSPTGTISFTPAANASGTALISVTVNNGDPVNNLTTQTFLVSVNPSGATTPAPTINPIGPITINSKTGVQSISLSGISSGATNNTGTVTLQATTPDTDLFQNVSVSYTPGGTTATLSYTLVAGQYGSGDIIVAVNNGNSNDNITTIAIPITVLPAFTPTLTIQNLAGVIQLISTYSNAPPGAFIQSSILASTLANGNYSTLINFSFVATNPVMVRTNQDPDSKRISKFYKLNATKVDPAMRANDINQNLKGGIDFAQSNLDLVIKRDGKGVILPMSQQNLDNIHIDGLIPVILNIKPVSSVPLFSKDIENPSSLET